MQRDADHAVLAWLDEQPAQSIWTTAVTLFEIRFGIEILASSRRRRALEDAFTVMLEEDFEGRIVSFDDSAAHAAAAIAAGGRRAGRTIDIRDVQIAGITSSRRATLATRNVRHFEGLGFPVVNPWSP